ncbi:MAG TPA: lamin tail domain-containing protein [Candidatus Paceibacterota bacterium]
MTKAVSKLFLLIVVTAPLGAAASVVISEIMYDLEVGADTGREWVEVQNTGSADVDFTVWKFFENGVNHELKVAQGSGTIPGGGFALIVDDAAKFLADHAGFSGLLFDSSFSLSNTGESLSLKNADVVIDTVSYSNTQGANGDGNSLQRSGNSWISASPTPGAVNATTASLPSAPANTDTSANATSANTTTGVDSSSSHTTTSVEEPKITASFEASKDALVGVDVTFVGYARGLKGEPLSSARYLWAFGDGAMKEGQSVLHTYAIPGEYVVVLEVSSDKYSASARTVIAVSPSRVTIQSFQSGSDGFIELRNGANTEVDLSFWQLSVGSRIFYIPKNTRVLGGKSVIFPNIVTGLSPAENMTLRYPNGSLATEYDKQEVPVAPSIEPAYVTPEPKQKVPEKTIVVAVEGRASSETESSASSSLAAVLEAGTPPSGLPIKWLFILGGVIMVAGAAYWVAGREKKNEFEIIDVSGKDLV